MASSKSEVWTFFEVINDGKSTQCKVCRATLSYKGGSTSSMRNHIKMRHKSASLGVDLKKQKTLLEFNTSRRQLTKATDDSMIVLG
jgi:hypothetical protein